MVLGILARLATFSLKKPKTVAIVVVVLAALAFGVHYNLLKGERDKLRVAEAGYKRAITAFVVLESILREDARIAAEATATLTAERNADRAALDKLRTGRADDEESVVWGAQQIPVGEVARLCEALPEMVGCE